MDVDINWVSVTVGILGGIISTFLYNKARKWRGFHSAIKSLRKEAIQNKPNVYIDITISYTNQEQEETLIHKTTSLIKLFEKFLKSNNRVLVIKGRWGTGKSNLCLFLASVAASKKNHIPINIDSSKINSKQIKSEITNQIIEESRSGISIKEFHDIFLKNEKTIIFMDALDQLPYLYNQFDTLDSILDFTSRHFIYNTNGAKIVLVVREEYFEICTRFRQLVDKNNIATLTILGFTLNTQIEKFVQAYNSKTEKERLEYTSKHIDNEMFRPYFERPKTLELIVKTPLDELEATESISLGKIYSLSFKNLPDEYLIQLEDIAFCMFIDDRYYFTLKMPWLTELGLNMNVLQDIIQKTGRLIYAKGSYSFEHASLRDYLVASKLKRSLGLGQGEKVLSARINHYLVPEFAASISSLDDITELLDIAKKTNNNLVMNNIFDIFSELDDEELRKIAKTEIKQFAKSLGVYETVSMKTQLLATVAAAFGELKPAQNLIKLAEEMGIENFLKIYFVSTDNFKYYGGSYDSFASEWMKALRMQKYAYVRIIAIYIFGELKEKRARSLIFTIKEDTSEDLDIRKYAAEALIKIDS